MNSNLVRYCHPLVRVRISTSELWSKAWLSETKDDGLSALIQENDRRSQIANGPRSKGLRSIFDVADQRREREGRPAQRAAKPNSARSR
jgi:hypothetical protein